MLTDTGPGPVNFWRKKLTPEQYTCSYAAPLEYFILTEFFIL
jgi:hypothetical protein